MFPYKLKIYMEFSRSGQLIALPIFPTLEKMLRRVIALEI